MQANLQEATEAQAITLQGWTETANHLTLEYYTCKTILVARPSVCKQQKLCLNWAGQSQGLSPSNFQMNVIYFIYIICNTTPFQDTIMKKRRGLGKCLDVNFIKRQEILGVFWGSQDSSGTFDIRIYWEMQSTTFCKELWLVL